MDRHFPGSETPKYGPGDRSQHGSFCAPGQRGVALAIVVWFLAAMSILVASMAKQARTDIKLTQNQVILAKMESIGDAALALSMVEKRLGMESTARLGATVDDGLGVGVAKGKLELFGVQFAGQAAVVQLVPIQGLIDINAVSQEMLVNLFIFLAGVDGARAESLSENVIKWRSKAAGDPMSDNQSEVVGSYSPRYGPLEAVEDLLLVEGVDREVFDAVRGAVFVGEGSQLGVNWSAAPIPVLALLLEGDMDSAIDVARSRLQSAEQNLTIPESLNVESGVQSEKAMYRVDVLLQGDSGTVLRRYWVRTDQVDSFGLPWKVLRSEGVRFLGEHELRGFLLPKVSLNEQQ